ncbi:ferrous iron transport protein B [Oscillospiraceae bacterium CM]|nr:ferrous iron transport protein B [Oscillospiraceae bacterium CM]
MAEKLEKTLNGLVPGQSAVILSVGGQSGAVKRRLVDMGLTPGTRVTVKRIAPFGDPVEVRIRGYELSLRREDAAQVGVGDALPARRKKTSSFTSYSARALDPETLRRMRLEHEHELNNHAAPYDTFVHDTRRMSIALVGNPNCGKTTLFNALTGSNQYVGNWPGVTVEKKEGVATLGDREITIVDLPGIYSLSPYSLEELVARDYIIGGEADKRPDAIINIVDATNLERNMYLTVQLLELERPMVMALNFMDEARKNGDMIDVARLSKEIGIPVIPISARTGENLEELLHVAHRQMHLGYTIEPDDLYDCLTHEIHHRVGILIHDNAYAANIPAHWASIKLLEGDDIVRRALRLDSGTAAKVDIIAGEYETLGGLGDRETLIADSRYQYIEHVVKAAVKKGVVSSETTTDRIDKIATHRLFAVPVFLAMMLLMFAVTFGPVGAFLSDGVAFMIDAFSGWLAAFLAGAHVIPWLTSLVTDGVISGVGGVLTFLPQIALLFFFLSLLEDTGYMARAAFIMDRLLRHFGLSGKAFIPMLMGFGCTVPAIMGARTMENEKDRRLTILLVPFMSCSAKLPVYGLIAAAFFGAWAGVAVFSLYLLGMIMAIVSGLFFKKTLFAGEPAPFVMELPPYRMPTLNNTLIHVWERVKDFLIRAGTLIFLMSIVLWFLQNFNWRLQMVPNSADGILAGIGTFIAPIFKPMGFGVWQAAVALLTGIIAKEAVVASLSMFYGFSLTASGAIVAAALTGFTPLSAFSYMVFILLYVPCVAAVSTIYREMNSLKWTVLSVGWQLAAAYVISLLVYQIGRLFGL